MKRFLLQMLASLCSLVGPPLIFFAVISIASNDKEAIVTFGALSIGCILLHAVSRYEKTSKPAVVWERDTDIMYEAIDEALTLRLPISVYEQRTRPDLPITRVLE